MIDVPETHHHKPERGRLTAVGCTTDDGPHRVHLLAAERELLAECHLYRVYLGLCGAELPVSELAASLCEPGCERMITYCQDCLSYAARCNTDAGLESGPGLRLDSPVRGGAGR
ncbi:MAG: hypothetical protein ACRDTA_26480 [Pseudonocardiaceae bacterium]